MENIQFYFSFIYDPFQINYSDKFNNVYNYIPTKINTPLGLFLLRYPDGFDADMAYQLRERNPTTLEDMQKNVVIVEANLLAKKSKLKIEKRVTIKEEPSTSSDIKLDTLVKTMEKMMEKMTLLDKAVAREPQGGPHIRNLNFRRQQIQIKQRDQINLEDQQ